MASFVVRLEYIGGLISLLTKPFGRSQRPVVKTHAVFLRAKIEAVGGSGRAEVNHTESIKNHSVILQELDCFRMLPE